MTTLLFRYGYILLSRRNIFCTEYEKVIVFVTAADTYTRVESMPPPAFFQGIGGGKEVTIIGSTLLASYH